MPYLIYPRKLRTHKLIRSKYAQVILQNFDYHSTDISFVRKTNFSGLVKPLYTISRSERGVEWTERVVMAYAVKQLRSARVRSLRLSIIKYWEEQGNYERAKQFDSRLRNAIDIGKKTLFNDFFLNFESNDKPKTAKYLSELMQKIEEEGFSTFINSGTLLGAARQGSFLSHDDDIDIAIVLNSNDELAVAHQFITAYNKLKVDFGEKIKTSFNSPVLKIKLQNDVTVDIFPAWFEDEKLYLWPHTYGEMTRAEIYPLIKLRLEDSDFLAPRNYEKMLSLNYGSGWTTPDTNFKFPWEKARKKFKRLLKAYWFFARLNFPIERLKKKK